jgi:acyl-coenzyme A thioesterase PaaI-like protein
MEKFGPIPKWGLLESIIGFKNVINLYPPYLGACIQIESIDKDFRCIQVSMDLKPYNENYVGVHFGGSLYSMCDPFYMFILMKNLGTDYIVWDKSAKIDFIKPGKGKVVAKFEIEIEELNLIKKIVSEKRKTDRIYTCNVLAEDGSIVAKIEKTLYVRKAIKNR